MSKTNLLLERIRVSIDCSDEMIANKAKEKMKRAGINTSTLHFRLYKKSIDARNKEDIRFECAVLVEGEFSQKALDNEYSLCYNTVKSDNTDNTEEVTG